MAQSLCRFGGQSFHHQVLLRIARRPEPSRQASRLKSEKFGNRSHSLLFTAKVDTHAVKRAADMRAPAFSSMTEQHLFVSLHPRCSFGCLRSSPPRRSACSFDCRQCILFLSRVNQRDRFRRCRSIDQQSGQTFSRTHGYRTCSLCTVF